MELVRLWGFARTVTDALWEAPRVDVEILQTAVYGVQQGGATNNFLRETGRKRRRQAVRTERARKCRIDELILQMANTAADVALRRRDEEEDAQRQRVEEDVQEEEEEEPYDPREPGSAEDERKVELRQRDGRLSPIWGLAEQSE